MTGAAFASYRRDVVATLWFGIARHSRLVVLAGAVGFLSAVAVIAALALALASAPAEP